MKKHFALCIAITAALCVSMPVAQSSAQSATVRGQIEDERGDAIMGAKAILADESNLVRETISDDRGQFFFSGVAYGSPRLKVMAKGFASFEQDLSLSENHRQAQLRIILHPTLKEVAEVNSTDSRVGLSSGSAADALVLKDRDLKALPDDPDQLQERLQDLAASSGGAPGSAEVSVDGFLTGGRLPPKSAMREVRINPDLYSAEHDKAPYQGGRIEIYTKPGALAFHGSSFFGAGNSALNARDAFARAKAPMTTRRYGFQVGGPFVKNRSGYALDFEARSIDEFAIVNAVTLDGSLRPTPFRANIATPKRLLIGSARVDYQVRQSSALIVRYDANSNSLSNQGVGGFNLPDRANSYDLTENSLRLMATTIINKATLNEARVALTLQQLDQRPASHDRAIDVLGAFTAGGAANQFLSHQEKRIELADSISIVVGKHNLKLGVQVYGRHVSDDRADNFNGTFTFGGAIGPQLDSKDRVVSDARGPALVNISGLEQYRRALLGLPGGTPTRFSIALGDPFANAGQWTVATYAQDEWYLRNNLSLNAGLRYEAQTNPADRGSWAPRLGLAYAPGKKQGWVLRARAGIFYDRLNELLALENRRLDGSHENSLVINLPSFHDPFKGGAGMPVVTTVRHLDPTLRPAMAAQMQLGFERLLPRGWKLALFHSWSRGQHVLRSRNINAPILRDGHEPSLAPRPLGLSGDVLEFESSGVMVGRVLFVGVNQMSNKFFNLYSGYLLFDFQSDTDGAFTLPQNSYDLTGERSRPTFQSRHRAFVIGTFNLPYKVGFTSAINFASGTPFNITTGRDNNGDGNFSDRPFIAAPTDPGAIVTRFGAFNPDGVNGTLGRNAGTNPSTITLDCNLSRAFNFGEQVKNSNAKYVLTLNARATNVLNHTNVLGFNGVLASPFFGLANVASAPRRVEVGVRFSF